MNDSPRMTFEGICALLPPKYPVIFSPFYGRLGPGSYFFLKYGLSSCDWGLKLGHRRWAREASFWVRCIIRAALYPETGIGGPAHLSNQTQEWPFPPTPWPLLVFLTWIWLET